MEHVHETRIQATIVCSLAFCLFLYGFISHNVFEEWDGVLQHSAGIELVNGEGYHGWPSKFWPPLYSLCIGLLSQITEPLAAGRIIAAISALILAWFVFKAAQVLSGNSNTAFYVLALTISSPLFLTSSFIAENHMMEATFIAGSFCFSCLALTKAPQSRYLVMAGILCALAGLTRYTSYSFAASMIITIFLSTPGRKRSFALALFFIMPFVLVSSPWWLYNSIHNGSPLYNSQYLNIGSKVVPPGAAEWWWQNQTDYNSISDIFLNHPKEYLLNFARNLAKTGIHFAIGTFTLFLIAILGAATIRNNKKDKSHLLLLIRRNKKPLQLALLYATIFTVLASQAFVFPEALLPLLIIGFAIGGTVFIELLSGTQVLKKTFWAIMLLSLATSFFYIRNYIESEHEDHGQLYKSEEITAFLRGDDHIDEKLVMSLHPARALYAGSRWVVYPLYHQGDLCDLLQWNGISQKVRDFAPRIPPSLPSTDLLPDYIVIDPAISSYHPYLSDILDGNTKPNCMDLITLHIVDDKSAVIQINKTE